MENASKALLMAAGVLLGILILSLAIYLFVSFGQTSAEINEKNRQQQIVQFNSQYTVYLGRKDLTIYEIRTIVSNARENNEYHNNEAEYKITVTVNGLKNKRTGALISGSKMEEKTEEELDAIVKDEQWGIAVGSSDLPTYTCTKIDYHNSDIDGNDSLALGRVARYYI